MRIGGIDPSIIRELSGIYRPFVKAFKELVSNAYDADADSVKIVLAEDLKSIEIYDDGLGMTPFEFRCDFTRIGGNHNRIKVDLTEKGRPRIGRKGIGFLAVARYCNFMEIVSSTNKVHKSVIICPFMEKLDLSNYLEFPLAERVLLSHFKVIDIYIIQNEKKIKLKQDNYTVDGSVIKFYNDIYKKEQINLEVHYQIDCNDLEIRAIIDFDYLLSLENRVDLEEINDFCIVEVTQLADSDKIKQHYTKIVLWELKPFVVDELRATKKSGNVRNIVSQDGITQFVWELSRCIPIEYNLPSNIDRKFGELLRSSQLKYIKKVTFSGGIYTDSDLKRPVWEPEMPERQNLEDDICAEVRIFDDDLVVHGYILGQTEVIFPSEYRGLTIRVKNVSIGQPGFLGLEKSLSGKHKTMLSQITGEINVLEGMDATDALNPGRESFYEENIHYKKLRKYIVGDTESLDGLLGKIIKNILIRNKMIANIGEYINRANIRRKSLQDISGAINYLATNADFSYALRSFFSSTKVAAINLPARPNHNMVLMPNSKISDFKVVNIPGLRSESVIDFVEQSVSFDFTQERWSWRIYILGGYYEIINKAGERGDPICEIDTQSQSIYINWNHPVREQIDEKSFIKSAIAWKLAHHICVDNVDKMINLGLNILSYSL